MSPRRLLAVILFTALSLGGCIDGTGFGSPAPATRSTKLSGPPPAPPPAAEAADRDVQTTIVPGISQPAAAVTSQPVRRLRSGDISLNFPAADVSVAAKAILGDLLGLQFSVSPDVHTTVTVVTQRPIARADVFRLFEASLANAGLAVTPRNGVYAILPVEQARGQAPVVQGESPGFATEVIGLNFISAEEFRRLIDPILPNVITQVDAGGNTIAVSGTSGQRASIRDLVRQFDVDWLRGTSFALFTPQRTDSRLIVPELDKLINAPGAPTRGLVRLIAMDRLNGILAVSTQRQYLDDVRRWVEVLDRQGESSERRVYVYHVQNGRSADLAKVLANTFGGRGGGSSAGETRRSAADGPASNGRDDLGQPTGAAPAPPGAAPQSQDMSNNAATPGPAVESVSVDIETNDLHAKVSSDETNNAVVVYATPRDYAVLEDALRKLDVPATQVMIEAAIVEVTLTDQLQYGVQWSFANKTSLGALSQGTTNAPVSLFPGFTYAYTHGSIAASLTALETLTKINVVSAPKLMVLNNQTATLQVGDQVPTLSETSTSTIGSNAPVVNSIEYRDTGVILKITPRVNSSGVVLLDLSQEVSAVQPTTSAAINSPTISTRKVATSVAVQDGEVIALGGLISNSVNNIQSGIPFLSRIKILNTLFGNANNTSAKTELIVLLRPVVVRSVDDGRALTDELRAKLQSLRPLLPASGSISIRSAVVAGAPERGYAMIAAVAAVAAFGYLALEAIAGGRSVLAAAGADQAQARLAAAADAGVTMTIHQLGLTAPSRRWSVTGPPRELDFQGVRLTIAMEDENGKIPLNFIRADQLRRLFEQAGADPRQIDGLVEAFIDLRGDPRPGGMPRIDPRLEAQRGPLSNLEELKLLPGMTPALYARIAPVVTVHAITLAFDPRTAAPLALAVMAPDNANTPAAGAAGLPPVSLGGRTITVRVDAADAGGGHLRRTAVVEFTGAASRPYVMRGLD